MGLLDGLMNRDMIFALGLLDAGSPKPVRTNIGAGLLSALGRRSSSSRGKRIGARRQRIANSAV